MSEETSPEAAAAKTSEETNRSDRPETGDLEELRSDVIASLHERNRVWGDLEERGERLDEVSRRLGEQASGRSSKDGSVDER